MPEHVARVCARVPPGLRGLRDKALLLIAVHIAARRSEVADLLVTDIVEHPRGLEVTIRATKGGGGRIVPVEFGRVAATCPVRAWRAWRDAAGLVDGPAFCQIRGRINVTAAPGEPITPQLAGLIIGELGRLAGLTLALTGHSARSGLITAAFDAGVDVAKICAISGHSPKSGTVYDYREDHDRWQDPANGGLY